MFLWFKVTPSFSILAVEWFYKHIFSFFVSAFFFTRLQFILMIIFFAMGYSFFTLIPPSFTPGSGLSQLTPPILHVPFYLS